MNTVSLVAKNVPDELVELIETISEEYPISFSGTGKPVRFRKIEAEETVSSVADSGTEILIRYTSVAAAARGIGTALSGLEGEEHTPFRMLGIMLDVSRGMVMKVDHLKKWFRRLALTGCNMVMLYTEDIYQLPGEPYFGRFRGAYSMDEIKELDCCAKRLGIEMIGCIQTLGHMEQALRWKAAYNDVSDTTRELLVDEEKTYKLIEKMIAFWSEALSSRRIHIGMDETQGLGRGSFLTRHGYENPFELLARHLERVNSICVRHGLSPMIWGDMYFRFGNAEHDYYNWESPIPESIRARIPQNIKLIYWDYYHSDEESYRKMIQRHKEIGFEPPVASGIWTWLNLWYNHRQTMQTVIPCIEACRKEKIKELFFTMWGDDGGYCNYDSSLMGIVRSADLAFGGKADDAEAAAKRFSAVCGGNWKAAEIAVRLADVGFNAALMIWDDPLMGIYYDKIVRKDGAESIDSAIALCTDMLRDLQPFRMESSAGNYRHLINIAAVLRGKMEFRRKFLRAYREKDIPALDDLASGVLPSLIAAVREFDRSFRDQWVETAKPFGLERIQIRNHGLIGRLEETILRLREVIDGKTGNIPELEMPDTGEIPATVFGYGGIAYSSVNIWGG